MGNNYLIVGFFIVILFNIFALLLNRDKYLPQKGMNTTAKRPKRVLNVVVLLFQFLGVALVSIGFALKLGIVAKPIKALGLLKDALIFMVPVLLSGYFLLRRRASRIDADHTS